MAKKMWGGRFTKEIDKDFFEFQKSVQYDHKLAKYDVLHSLIHVQALSEDKEILSLKEAKKLTGALKKIKAEIDKSKFKYDRDSEDIHTDIQNKVEKMVGKLALKLHTLRSRNDQVAFDEKCYCREEAAEIEKLLAALLKSLEFLKGRYGNTGIVGYTHTQRAQKILFKDYLDAFSSMFTRDLKRISNFWKKLEIHIGAGALAGSSIKSNYEKAIKKVLGADSFVKTSLNPLDDVSDRDFIIEFLGIVSILQMHMSRLAEDLMLYSTKEFNFVSLPEEYCTGSSMMPHKKNPDLLELMRGYTGRIYGNLISILTTMKGLPSSYNRDMQLDKEPLFSSVEIIKWELRIMARFIYGITLNRKAIDDALKDEALYATEKAERLVREKKMSFKEAHTIVGRMTRSKDARV